MRIRNRGGLKNVAIKTAGSMLTETGQGWVVCVYWVVQSAVEQNGLCGLGLRGLRCPRRGQIDFGCQIVLEFLGRCWSGV